MRLSWLVRKTWNVFSLRSICLLLFIAGVLFLGYLCPDWLCSTQPPVVTVRNDDTVVQPWTAVESDQPSHANLFPPSDLVRKFHFDGDHDILVFLHIQKTGGSTFGRHLVRDAIGVPVPCDCQTHRKRCNCTDGRGRQWLFSRYSTGWVCGLHADWTELHECVPSTLDEREGEKRQRRYLYFTVLRDPIQRYISEWKHVQRGSTWQSAKLMCNGRQASLHEVPFCFQGSDWTGVSLEEFMSCRHNLANNRQTRMLANLTLVGCYDRSVMPDSDERDRVLLRSAKDNLRQMAFFGLTEHQPEMRYLFEQTFGMQFRRDFSQFADTHASKVDLTEEQLTALRSLNRLDVELYKYASELFADRVRRAKETSALQVKRTDGVVDEAGGQVVVVVDTAAAAAGINGINDVNNYKADDDGDEDDVQRLGTATV